MPAAPSSKGVEENTKEVQQSQEDKDKLRYMCRVCNKKKDTSKDLEVLQCCAYIGKDKTGSMQTVRGTSSPESECEPRKRR